MLPIVATLLSQGLGTLANAVINKGKEVVEEKLGIDLEAAVQTPEGLTSLRQAEIDHEEFLIQAAIENRKLDIEEKKVELADTANARDSNVKIQESANASWLAKNAIYLIAFAVVAGGGFMVYTSKEADARMAAVSAVMLVLGFFFGTTHNNSRKDATIANLAQGANK